MTRRSLHILLAPWLVACSGDAGTTMSSATSTGATTSATTEAGSTGSTGASTGSTGDGEAAYDYAIVLEHATYLMTPHAADSPLGGGAMIDPGTLHLFLSELESTCANPEPQWSCAANNSRLHLAIPPDSQAVGVHAIPAEIIGTTYFACEGDDCGCVQAESLITDTSTLEITAIDAALIVGEHCRGTTCTAFSAMRC
ncbi:MAG: hypothetical protein H6711_16890 [Myxococcales bacterium]|nr:hypothetical protein [Myxococcales bacterium]